MGIRDEVEVVRLTAVLRGFSFKRLATDTGLNYERVQRVLRHERQPRPGEITALRRVLGLDSSRSAR